MLLVDIIYRINTWSYDMMANPKTWAHTVTLLGFVLKINLKTKIRAVSA